MHYYAILAAVAAAATQQTLPAPRAAAAPLVKNDKDSTNDEVCVIITGFDTEDTVGDAVASVLEQTHSNLKIVFVDDGSRDATRCAVEHALAGDTRDHSVADGLQYMASWNAAMLMSQDLMAAMMASMTKQTPTFKD